MLPHIAVQEINNAGKEVFLKLATLFGVPNSYSFTLSYICVVMFFLESCKDYLVQLEMVLKYIRGMVLQSCERRGNIRLHGTLIKF